MEAGGVVEHWVGRHQIVIDGDRVVLRLRGPYPPEDFLAIRALMEGYTEQYDQVYLVINVREVEPFPAETRKAWAQWIKNMHRTPPIVAIVGASFTMRTIVKMMTAVRRIVAPHTPSATLFHTEEEAVSFLEARRKTV